MASFITLVLLPVLLFSLIWQQGRLVGFRIRRYHAGLGRQFLLGKVHLGVVSSTADSPALALPLRHRPTPGSRNSGHLSGLYCIAPSLQNIVIMLARE